MWIQLTAEQRIALTHATSKKRLQPYRRALGGHERDALDLYVLDANIASLLHAQLRLVETVLREQIHRALSNAYGSSWYHVRPDGTTAAGLGNTCRSMVQDAVGALRREGGGGRGKPQRLAPDKVIAELMLGFWAKTLDTPGDADHARTIWAAGVENAFNQRQHQHASAWSQDQAKKMCHRLTWARNRVNHCESVVFGFPQKGMQHQGKQLRLPPSMILESCRTLVGRFDGELEAWMRNSTDIDQLIAEPLAQAAWADVEGRASVTTPSSAPSNMWDL